MRAPAKTVGDDRLLLRGEAGAVPIDLAGRDVAIDGEGLLAALAVLDHAVLDPVEPIAPGEDGIRDHLSLGGGQGRVEVRGVGGHSDPLLRAPQLRDSGLRQVEARRHREEPVVLVGVARRADHRVAPAVGSAGHVRPIWGLAVRRLDQRLGHGRQGADGLIPVVQACLRVDPERRPHRSGVSGVRADHREAELQAALASRIPERGRDIAVETAVALVEIAPAPVGRQAHLESDAVGLAVDLADAFVHVAANEAVLADLDARQRAGRDDLGAGDHGAAVLERDERFALPEGSGLRR